MYGVIIGRLKILEIPVFTRCITELSVGASVGLMALLSAAAGGYTVDFFQGRLMPMIFLTGFVVAVFWATSMTIFHPFNACLGPGEKQTRTLKLAVGVAGIDVTLAGISALGVAGLNPSIMTLEAAVGIIFLGAAVWIGGYYAFIKAAIKESASVMWTGFPEAKK
jgi:tetrahydromethanopterin S-methyltransferase subunit C